MLLVVPYFYITASMLEVGFDIRPLQTAHRFRGIGKYTAELLKALRENRPEIRFHAMGLAGAGEVPRETAGESYHTVRLPADHRRLRTVAADFLRTPRVVKEMAVDLMHYTMQVVALPFAVPAVITVHDCIPAIFSPRGYFTKETLYFRLQAAAARRAARVITVSNASMRDIVRYMGVSPKNVRVIYEAYAGHYRPEAAKNPSGRINGLPNDYLLYVGATDYRKNIKGLIEIYGRYSESVSASLPLVIVGKPEYFRRLRFTWPKGTHGGIVGGRVVFTGFVPEESMPALYTGARAFVFPSLYEGFGLPALEAMACGTPVIAYDNSSVSEIVGRWGLLVPTGDVESFVKSLVRLAEDDALRNELAAAGLERAGHFSWAKAAAETAEVYREAAWCA